MKAIELSVLTYNIHGAIGEDLSRVADLVSDLCVEIAALQEVDSRRGPHTAVEQIELLENLTGLRAVAGPLLKQDERHYGNLLLTGYPLLSINRINLSQPKREPRGAIDALIETPAGPLRVVATHLGLSPVERHSQIDQLFSHICDHTRPTLLMGDFNEWIPGLGVLPRIHNLFGKRKTPRTFPSRLPILALDRICSLPPDLIESICIPNHPNCRNASDHRPLMAKIRLQRKTTM